MKDYVPILISLPPDLVSQLDKASSVLGWTRMALIRRCIIRDMQYVLERELPGIIKAKGAEDHFYWLQQAMKPHWLD